MKNKNDYILISKIASETPYSQEYLSLLVRRGKIHGRKIGKNWTISKNALVEYLQNHQQIILPLKQSVFPIIPPATLTAEKISPIGHIRPMAENNLTVNVKKELDELEEIYQNKITNDKAQIINPDYIEDTRQGRDKLQNPNVQISNEEKESQDRVFPLRSEASEGQVREIPRPDLNQEKFSLGEVSLSQKYTGAYYIKKIIQWVAMVTVGILLLGYILGGFNMGFIFDFYGLIKR